MKTIAFSLFIALAIILGGCSTFSANRGGNVSGGLVVNDQRSLAAINEDQTIRHVAHTMIVKHPAFRDSHIAVGVYNHDVLLVGETPQASLRVKAEKMVSTVRGVHRIYNEISISSPSSLITRSSDVWITTKVRAQMVTKAGLKSSQIKVVTENGTVYLMGHVTHRQADLAVDVARRIAGVQRVVKVFRYR